MLKESRGDKEEVECSIWGAPTISAAANNKNNQKMMHVREGELPSSTTLERDRQEEVVEEAREEEEVFTYAYIRVCVCVCVCV
jgi:hypothetical protein